MINIKLDDLKKDQSLIPKDKSVIVADYVGIKSKEAVRILTEKGYDNIFSLIGGISDWESDGMPIKIDKNRELTGSCACQLRPRKINNDK